MPYIHCIKGQESLCILCDTNNVIIDIKHVLTFEFYLNLCSYIMYRAGKSNSHVKIGWQMFTDSVIRTISNLCDHVVFILMGNFAQKKEILINAARHTVIKTAHPSPLAANVQYPFYGSGCFSQCNKALQDYGYDPLSWKL